MKQLRDDPLFAEDIIPAPVSEGDGIADAEMPDTEAKDATVDDEGSSLPEDEPEKSEEISEDQNDIELLKEEIRVLKEELSMLEEFKKNQDRILNELADFAALFPEVAVDEIPEEVWASVRKGTALTASYALYEKRKASEAIRTANINAKNASRSPGTAGTNTAGEYFSPDDVRRMSRAEVHANYSKIQESMKKWMQK